MGFGSRLERARRRIAAGSATPRDQSLVAGAMLLGALAGALLAHGVVQILPLSTRGVAAARAAGVVSATVRAGYPKDSELLFLAGGLALTAAASLAAGAAAAWLRAGAAPAAIPAPPTEPPARFGRFEALVLVALLIYGMQPTPLLTAAWEWRLLLEEGAHLHPANSLLLGERIYADVGYLYGPLLVLPLALGFELTTPSVFTARVVTLAMHGLGLALVAAAGRAMFRTRVAWLLCCVGLAALVPLAHPRAHLTALRPAVTLIPLFFLPAMFRGRRVAAYCVGAAVTPALFTSPEVGAVTLFAALAATVLGADAREASRRLLRFGAGLGVSAAIVAALLHPYVDSVLYLRDGISTLGWAGMGHLSRPFPVPWGADRLWLGDPYGVGLDASGFLLRGSVLDALLVACGVALAFLGLRRAWTPRELTCAVVWLIAVGLLPKLIARPGPHQLAKLLPPLILLVGVWVEGGWRMAAARRGPSRVAPAALCAASLVGLVCLADPRVPRWPPRVQSLDARLGPIPVDPALAHLVTQVRAEVDRALPPGAPIWVTPNAPGWHMLLDRPSAVRTPDVFTLATAEQRREVRRALEARPPTLLLRHRVRDEIDGVPANAYAPEIAAFARANYQLVRRVVSGTHRAEILKRR
ncbi:MAG: hypothetical protein JSU66_16250 [Deltaproteobacteria bacterium]|nr:MAG: hypothetical protein JSU66_16250 [Deltaproteobacteria bacterium]